VAKVQSGRTPASIALRTLIEPKKKALHPLALNGTALITKKAILIKHPRIIKGILRAIHPLKKAQPKKTPTPIPKKTAKTIPLPSKPEITPEPQKPETPETPVESPPQEQPYSDANLEASIASFMKK